MKTLAAENNPFNDISHDEAAEIIADMEERSYHSNGATDVWKGKHPTRGSIYVVVPPMGTCLLLPFVIQQAVL